MARPCSSATRTCSGKTQTAASPVRRQQGRAHSSARFPTRTEQEKAACYRVLGRRPAAPLFPGQVWTVYCLPAGPCCFRLLLLHLLAPGKQTRGHKEGREPGPTRRQRTCAVNGVADGPPPQPLPAASDPFVEWLPAEQAGSTLVSGAPGGAYEMQTIDGVLHSERMSNSVCVQCRKPMPRGLVCSGCRRVAYCSRECQKLHWRARHKTECSKPAELD